MLESKGLGVVGHLYFIVAIALYPLLSVMGPWGEGYTVAEFGYVGSFMLGACAAWVWPIMLPGLALCIRERRKERKSNAQLIA